MRPRKLSATIYIFQKEYGKGGTITLSKEIAERLRASRVRIYAAKGIIVLCPTAEPFAFTVHRYSNRVEVRSIDAIRIAELNNKMKTTEVRFLRNGCIELIFPNYEGATFEDFIEVTPKKNRTIFAKVYESGKSKYLLISKAVAKRLKGRYFLVYAARGIIVLCPIRTPAEKPLSYTAEKRPDGILRITVARAIAAAELSNRDAATAIRILENGCIELIFQNYNGEEPRLIPSRKLVSLHKKKLGKIVNYTLYLSTDACRILGNPRYVNIYANTGIILIEASRERMHKVGKVDFGCRITITAAAANLVKLDENPDLEHVDIGKGRLLLIFSNYEGAKDLLEV